MRSYLIRTWSAPVSASSEGQKVGFRNLRLRPSRAADVGRHNLKALGENTTGRIQQAPGGAVGRIILPTFLFVQIVSLFAWAFN
jgi:hypothetical protein